MLTAGASKEQRIPTFADAEVRSKSTRYPFRSAQETERFPRRREWEIP